jgi:hypothetical protein
MFNSKREGKERLTVDDDPELRRGIDSLELARRFCTQDIPAAAAKVESWPDWAPPLDPAPSVGTDEEIGNRFFFGALDWILRHEIAHLALRHAERQKIEGISDQACETEADLEATRWLRGDRQADEHRPAGAQPREQELQLEWRAISIGLGLIWVALFEADRGQRNTTHPPVADRLFACLNELKLREDSAAAEILSDIVQAWIGPEDKWAPEGGHPTAHDAIAEAVFRLHRHLLR